jgi:hypothetical protein
LYPGLLEHVAAGHILTGFMQRQPTYVKMALNILKHLPSNADVLVSQVRDHYWDRAVLALQQCVAQAA